MRGCRRARQTRTVARFAAQVMRQKRPSIASHKAVNPSALFGGVENVPRQWAAEYDRGTPAARLRTLAALARILEVAQANQSRLDVSRMTDEQLMREQQRLLRQIAAQV